MGLRLVVELYTALGLRINNLIPCYIDLSDSDVVVPRLNFDSPLDLTPIELVSCLVCEDELSLCGREFNATIGNRRVES